jgi:hypothetical protein
MTRKRPIGDFLCPESAQIASGILAFPIPRWELHFQRGELNDIVILILQEVNHSIE